MGVDRFEILFVCHANLCRSPLAERVCRRILDDVFGPAAGAVVVSSAGTHAFAGSRMHHGSAQVLGELGIDASGFASRPMTPSILSRANLVLVAGREQRKASVTMVPETVRRTFTLRQFVRLVEALPAEAGLTQGSVPDRLGTLVQQVNSVRHRVQPVAGHEDDLPDPVGQPTEAFRVCSDEVQRAMRTIIGVIARP